MSFLKWPCSLRILANNYSLELDGKTVAFSDSQFLYTIQKYVEDECPYIEGSKVAAPVGWDGKKVQFETNMERKVIAFTPTAGVAIPAGQTQPGPTFHCYNSFLVTVIGVLWGEVLVCIAAAISELGESLTRGMNL